MSGKAYRIGICVRYGTDLYTLAMVNFNRNGDVVLSQHHGDYNKMNRTKWNPHVTYHADGTFHFAAHKGNAADGGYSNPEQREQLVQGFRGPQYLPDYGFGRDSAKAFNTRCTGYDYVVEVDSLKLHENSASFSVVLLAPGSDPSTVKTVGDRIETALVTNTFPWCLITVQNYVPI